MLAPVIGSERHCTDGIHRAAPKAVPLIKSTVGDRHGLAGGPVGRRGEDIEEKGSVFLG